MNDDKLSDYWTFILDNETNADFYCNNFDATVFELKSLIPKHAENCLRFSYRFKNGLPMFRRTDESLTERERKLIQLGELYAGRRHCQKELEEIERQQKNLQILDKKRPDLN